MLRLLETGRPQARIGLPPAMAGTLAAEQTYALTIQGRTVDGTLVAFRPDLETGTRTVVALFDVELDVPVTAGEIVELSLISRVAGAGTWIPISALQEGETGLWSLFVVVDDDGGPVIAREAVEIIHVADQRAYVRGTFADGSRIVVAGTNRITPGQRVAIAED